MASTSKRSNRAEALLVLVWLAAGACGGSSGSGGTPDGGSAGGDGGPPVNVMPVSVNGALCSAGSWPNKPCVSVTVCLPDGSSCQTVDDILLDTGSTGLRIFRQALPLALPIVTSGAAQLATCVQFADGTADWGPLATARVVLAGEPPVLVTMHLIDATFGTVPSACGTPERGPQDAGLNGVLGLSTFAQDCGSGCVNDAQNGIYYACTGQTCTGTGVPLAQQIQNPAALLGQDGNGFLIKLPPAVADGHAPSLDGQLVFGIGTRSNNAPASVTTYTLDSNGEFTTTVSGKVYPSSFLDTGSNGYFFDPPTSSSLPVCAAPNDSWYCPATRVAFQATSSGTTGAAGPPVAFQIENFQNFAAIPDAVSVYIGGPAPAGAGFDWGLPLFLGRTVFVGLEGKSSALGKGMYWAY